MQLEASEQLPNHIRYTGQQYDDLTGQYYLRARYYNPELGRFMQEDVYQGDGLNLYAYCSNNPVVYYDPSGYKKGSNSGCPPASNNGGDGGAPEGNESGSSSYSLLPSEGEIGTYRELLDAGEVGDNITPHHMPSAEYMSQYGVGREDGLCMNMEMPSPGTGGRHRLTDTYGRNMTDAEKAYYYSLSPRDALAYDIANMRQIYQSQGLYSEIRPKLQEYIKKYMELMPELFDK